MRIIFLLWLIGWMPASVAQARQDPPCDPGKRPVIFVHGFLSSGDNWALQAQRLEANGYCPDKLFVFDWNSLNRQSSADSILLAFIRQVCRQTGDRQVDLVGHSAGGGLCSRLLANPEAAALVAHYVHIGSGALPGPPGKVPTLNIYSQADLVAGMAGAIPGASNLQQSQTDHLEVVTAYESFEAILAFLQPAQKPHDLAKPQSQPEIAGRAVVLGENTPLSGAGIEVWAWDRKTGNRQGKAPEWQGEADAAGYWKGFRARAGVAYEFVLRPRQGRVVHYFHAPFRYSNRLLYLRGLPGTGMAAMLLRSLPADKEQSALALFSANRAFITGRDTLTCNGVALSTPQLTAPAKTCIALFLFDEGKDQAGTGKPLAMFGAIPFLNGADLPLPSGPAKRIRLHYNGQDHLLPSVPSSEGVMVAVFE